MRTVRFLMVGLVAVLISSCGASSPKELLIGKWEATEEKDGGTVEFEKDGKMRGVRGIMALQGKYRWTDDKTVDIDIDNPFAGVAAKFGQPAGETTIKLKYTLVSINKDELVATDANGKTIKFKRVK